MNTEQLATLSRDLEAAGDDPTRLLKVHLKLTLARERERLRAQLDHEARADEHLEVFTKWYWNDDQVLNGYPDVIAVVAPLCPNLFLDLLGLRGDPDVLPVGFFVNTSGYYDLVKHPGHEFELYTDLPRASRAKGRILDVPVYLTSRRPPPGIERDYVDHDVYLLWEDDKITSLAVSR